MKHSKNVLVVEDEPLISMMVEDFLEALGHRTAGTADCVADALGVLRETAVDAVVLDMNLCGGESSAPVAEELARMGIPFVVASGGTGDGPDAFRGRPMLAKPFTLSGMEQALARL